MATGETHQIFIGTARIIYTEYQLQPSDRNKSIAQIAREQIGTDRPTHPIYRKVPPSASSPIYAEVRDPLDPNWTLLLPPSEYASFTIIEGEKVRTSPKIENNNILYDAATNSRFLYKKNTVFVDSTNNLVWADVSRTDPQRNGGKPYWVCVKYMNSHRTKPAINGPSN